MKVVLFCGGEGFRLPGQMEALPKPMTTIGYRPILWHVMRCYSYHGYKNFLVCLGDRGEAIKNYFLRYNEALSNDFILSDGGRSIELLNTDIGDWNITFVDTGRRANVAERLRSVRSHLHGDDLFCANYADNLTDARLRDLIDDFRRRDKVAAVLSVRPNYSFHIVSNEPDGTVTAIDDITAAGAWVNGGYFIFRPEIFDFIEDGDDLMEAPFQRLIAAGQLVGYRHCGFWQALDTLKDLQSLQALHDGGRPPWAPWLNRPEALATDQPAGSG